MMTLRAVSGDRAFPRPVAVWPSGSLDLLVAFPESITPAMANSLVGRTISYTESGRRADQVASPPRPAGVLRIAGARLADSGRTLLLATDPHPRPAHYRLHLGAAADGFDCEYDLSGVEAAWSKAGQEGAVESEPDWKGWWPELDLDASRRLSRGSAPHERGLKRLEEPGRLAVAAQVILPPGEVQVRIESSSPVIEAMLGDEQPAVPDENARGSGGRAAFTLRSRGEPLFLTFTVETGLKSRLSALRIVYRVGNEGAFRAIERDRLSLPWVALATGSARGRSRPRRPRPISPAGIPCAGPRSSSATVRSARSVMPSAAEAATSGPT
jgi:hypothetical protein